MSNELFVLFNSTVFDNKVVDIIIVIIVVVIVVVVVVVTCSYQRPWRLFGIISYE